MMAGRMMEGTHGRIFIENEDGSEETVGNVLAWAVAPNSGSPSVSSSSSSSVPRRFAPQMVKANRKDRRKAAALARKLKR